MTRTSVVGSVNVVRTARRARRASAVAFVLVAGALFGVTGCREEAAPIEDSSDGASPGAETTVVGRAIDDQPFVLAMNDGRAAMGRFDFADAQSAFDRALARRPRSVEAERNRAIALLNQSTDGAQERAIERLEALGRRVQASDDAVELDGADPTDERARIAYSKGLALLYLGRTDEAAVAFDAAVRLRSNDAYAAFFLAQCVESIGRIDDARAWYERATELDPYLRSALLGLQRCLARTGDEVGAAAALDLFQRLASVPRSRLAEFKYTRMGPLGEVTLETITAPRDPRPPAGAPFQRAVTLSSIVDGTLPSGSIRAIVPADLDGDGALDLLVTIEADDSLRTAMLRGSDGRFEVVEVDPLVSVEGVHAWHVGDVDLDGRDDLYGLRDGPNVLLLRGREGASPAWLDATDVFGASGGDLATRDAALVDLDHDGDLDLLLVHGDGPDAFLANEGGERFRDRASEVGLTIDEDARVTFKPSRAIVVADLDLDRDADLVILHDGPPHRVLRNDRLWTWRPDPRFDAIANARLDALVPWYATEGGTPELRGIEGGDRPAVSGEQRSPGGRIVRLAPDDAGTWALTQADGATTPGTRALAVADATGDGAWNLLVGSDDGASLHDAFGGRLGTLDGVPAGIDVVVPIVRDASRGPELLAIDREGNAWFAAAGPGRGRFAALEFSGRDDPSQQMRSNPSGIGVRFAARAGTHWQFGCTWRTRSGPGAGHQPVALGVSDLDALDLVEIDWPDGVFQSEGRLVAETTHAIVETQRQISSCPLLFARIDDEPTPRFVSDVLGVGGIGYLAEPRVGAGLEGAIAGEARPRERFLLPRAVVPDEARSIELRLSEPMEEVLYLDSATLDVWSLPPGWDLALDERMGTAAPFPTGEPVFHRLDSIRTVTSAIDAAGVERVARVRETDGDAIDFGGADHRFIGLLEKEGVVELSFDRALPRTDGWLIVDGWVEYPYSQTVFAAWQTGRAYEPISIEARAGDADTWITVAERIGYPAGMPRRCAFPLGTLPADVVQLRLRTTQEVFIDAVRVVRGEPCPDARVERLVPDRAELVFAGFPRRTVGAHRRPHYDHAMRDPLWDTRAPFGRYTALGDCLDLVRSIDDASAILAPGDEVILSWELDGRVSRSRDERPGWTRRFVLDSAGWCKDMDLLTRDGETVEPLPARSGEPDAAARERMDRSSVRIQGGR